MIIHVSHIFGYFSHAKNDSFEMEIGMSASRYNMNTYGMENLWQMNSQASAWGGFTA